MSIIWKKEKATPTVSNVQLEPPLRDGMKQGLQGIRLAIIKN